MQSILLMFLKYACFLFETKNVATLVILMYMYMHHNIVLDVGLLNLLILVYTCIMYMLYSQLTLTTYIHELNILVSYMYIYMCIKHVHGDWPIHIGINWVLTVFYHAHSLFRINWRSTFLQSSCVCISCSYLYSCYSCRVLKSV